MKKILNQASEIKILPKCAARSLASSFQFARSLSRSAQPGEAAHQPADVLCGGRACGSLHLLLHVYVASPATAQLPSVLLGWLGWAAQGTGTSICTRATTH